MKEQTLNHRRVAKNTVVLYIRTIVTLCISLYTSRAVLNVLGVEDFGIYNVVGGFVIMFSIVSSTLVSATQRYLNFELGKLEGNKSLQVFNSAFLIHVTLSLILLLLFESLGLWFLNNYLNIPQNRMDAAKWVFQFSVLSFILSIIRSPFEASIIAHERMKTFAYANILECLLRLGAVFILMLPWKNDILVIYGLMILVITIIIFAIYFFYCKKQFQETKFTIVKEKEYYSEMLKFAGYNFVGASSVVFAQQGVNLLLNIYFGVVVNAARGVTNQIQSAISKFVNDFTTALNPQITKSYAQGDTNNMMLLIYKGTKIAYLLFLFFSVPIIIEAPYILLLWLKNVPEFACLFVRLSLIDALINSLAGPISTGAMATGNIKKMSLWIGVIRFMVFPFSYIAFRLGGNPYYAYYILIFSDLVLFWVRLSIASRLIGVTIKPYVTKVLFKILPVTALSFLVSYVLSKVIVVNDFWHLVLFVGATAAVILLASAFIAFDKFERKTILSMIKKK